MTTKREFSFRNGIASFYQFGNPDLVDIEPIQAPVPRWERELASAWGKTQSAGALIEEGCLFNMDNAATERKFSSRGRGYTSLVMSSKMRGALEAEGLLDRVELDGCSETPVGDLDPALAELTSVFGDEVGPYEAEVNIHMDTFREAMEEGVEFVDAFEAAKLHNDYLRRLDPEHRVATLSPERPDYFIEQYVAAKKSGDAEAASVFFKRARMLAGGVALTESEGRWSHGMANLRGAIADDPTDLSFYPVVEDEGEQVDSRAGSRWDHYAEIHVADERARTRAENCPVGANAKALYGVKTFVTDSREARFQWLGRWFLSRRTVEEVRLGRKRLMEAIDENNRICREAAERGNQAAWLAAILSPDHKRRLMALCRELLNGERRLGRWAEPPAHKKPWMPGQVRRIVTPKKPKRSAVEQWRIRSLGYTVSRYKSGSLYSLL